MSQVNRGKEFETIIKKGFEKIDNVSIDRFPDPMAGYLGIRNICDFSIYKKPFKIYIECKTTHGNTLNFNSQITKNQWQGLTEKSKIDGVISLVLVWFIQKEKTIAVPIQELRKLKEIGHKSLNVNKLEKVKYFEVPGKKKRVFYNYNIKEFLRMLYEWKSKED